MALVTELPVESLPSKGYGYKFNLVKLPQLVFNQILQYQAELEKCSNELSTMLVQLKHLLVPLENGGDISMYDALPLMAIRSYISASDKLTDYLKVKYLCPIHNKYELLTVDLKALDFDPMDPILPKIKSVKLKDEYYKFRIPTVSEFIEVANTFKLVVPISHATKFIWLLSCFSDVLDPKYKNKVVSAVLNADSSDIITLNKMYELVTGAFKYFHATCKNGGEGGEPVIVRINTISPITDVFQNILINQELDKTSFDTGEVNQN